jgi:two-component system response regulator
MNTKAILLVEDNKSDEMLTLLALKKNNIGNPVVVARDGEEALDYLFATGPHVGRDPTILPQLILLDLNLPRLSGLDVLRRIRADDRTKLSAVVILTSSKEDEDVINSYSLGANAYVRKPVDFAQFSEAVRTLGLFWLVLNEMPQRT